MRAPKFISNSKYISIVCTCFVSICILVSLCALIYTRTSYINGKELLNNDNLPYKYSYMNSEAYSLYVDRPEVLSFEKLRKEADLIAKVTILNTDESGIHSRVARAKIDTVFKSMQDTPNEITIIEPLRLMRSQEDNYYIMADGAYAFGFMPLINNASYLVFLTFHRANIINNTPIGADYYYFMTSPYSRILLNSEIQSVDGDSLKNTIRARDYSNANIIVPKKNIVNEYQKNTNFILKQFNIEL